MDTIRSSNEETDAVAAVGRACAERDHAAAPSRGNHFATNPQSLADLVASLGGRAPCQWEARVAAYAYEQRRLELESPAT